MTKKSPTAKDSFLHFDHHAENHHRGIERIWEKMQDLDSLSYSSRYGGFYVITRHSDLRRVAGNPGTFSSAKGIALPDEDRSNHIPAEVDPPSQRQYRSILSPLLTPEAMSEHAETLRKHAKSLLANFDESGHVEFVEKFAKPFPIGVSLELFGFPVSDARMLDFVITCMIDKRGTEAGKDASRQLTDYINRFLRERETSKERKNDIVGAIVYGEIDGRRLSAGEKLSMTRLLLFGGFTTVMNALSYSLYLFATQPEVPKWLRNTDEEGWGTAIEEIVRFASPATYLRRTVTTPVELSGTRLSPGDEVLLSFAAANRDSAAFDQPEVTQLEWHPNPHVAFGHGPHRCLGVSLARLELRIALSEILHAYEHFELASDRPIDWESGETQGIASLPLIMSPHIGRD